MRTDAPPAAALFLFAHQDDEYGVFQRILDCRRRGLRVACAYLTDGATASASAATRNAESLAVLGQLGVAAGDIAFAGLETGIGDGRLPHHLAPGAAWLERWFGRWLECCGAVDSLHVPAWEGGHHDHDAVHVLGVTAAAQRGWLARSWQYPLYQAAGLPGSIMLRVMAPLPANGPVTSWPIAWPARLRFLRYCLAYPSQRRIWAWLFPHVLAHYLRHGVQALQPVSLARLGERPHPGPLYYEKRKLFTWNEMQAALAAWRAASPNHQ
jgi:LmbE family N-acetylglucosaminyl deacetylase